MLAVDTAEDLDEVKGLDTIVQQFGERHGQSLRTIKVESALVKTLLTTCQQVESVHINCEEDCVSAMSLPSLLLYLPDNKQEPLEDLWPDTNYTVRQVQLPPIYNKVSK